MNFPGKVGGYWRWRYQPYMLTQDTVQRLGDMTELYGRVPQPKEEPQTV